MAQEIGRNIVFPIYNADGTPFHDLVIRKATYDEVVMSLGRKIVGDVYYKSNTLDVTMTEYIEYNGVQYKLVNPPTVVKEGMVSDNGDAKGMTKYSFTFYHPEYELSNLPFTDIAVDQAEIPYKSQDKTFYWIGNLIDFIAKLNANLVGTQWIVRMTGNEESAAKALKLSDVLPFDQVFIADALKTAYDTWEIPYTVDKLSSDDAAVAQGKMFAIYFGKPSNEIYEDDNSLVPFVFKCGQGLGLKNDSRTPKNNKIVTRIVGHGSEDNIPYGYPQIRWYGDDDASFTYGDHAGVYEDVTIGGVHFDKVVSYPIYEGIVNGEYVKLIKHPFTRKNLMPSVYAQTVFNNVSPYLARTGSTLIVNTNYDPDTELIDYYDAIDEQDFQYVNNIDPNAPSVEYHEFEDIKPKINPQTALVSVEAYNTQEEEDKRSAESISEADFLEYLDQEEHRCELSRLVEDQNALTMMEQAYNTGENASYEKNGGATNVKWTLTFTNGACIAQYRSSTPIAFDYYVVEEVSTSESESESVVVPAAWDDTMDANGEYRQSYFKATLPTFNFDLYACASITQEMKLYMRSGACQGCTFEVMVDWEDYKKNFYDEDGNFDPVIGEGHPRNGEKYPDSRTENITVIVKKDLDTFGVLMPNTFQMIAAGDTFAILGISLPESYITDAEQELDEAMKEYMLENNVYYFEYPLKFDEFFFAKHPFILEQMRMNTIVRFDYANEPTKVLYVKQMTIKWGVSPLPQYSITLTDDIEVVLNQIGRTTEDVSRLRVQMSEIQKYYGSGGEGGSGGRNEYLSRIMDDVAAGRITFQQGLDALGRVIFSDDIYSNGFVSGMDTTGRGWRIDRLGNGELESLRVRSFLEVIELLVNRLQAQEGDTLFTDNDQIEYVEEKQHNNDTYYKLTLKEKWEGYFTALNFAGHTSQQSYGVIIKGIINTLAANAGNVSDVSESDCRETDGENKYYTSWMRVIEPSSVNDSVDTNQICVILYADDRTPARKNFPPCELMTIARWGCEGDTTEQGMDEGLRQQIERRQRLFSISVTDGRISKLTGVSSPILQEWNYGTTLGVLPEFINNWSIRDRLIAGRDYLYAQGVIVGDFIKVDIHGAPLTNYVDCGEWVNGGAQGVTPEVGAGIYLYNEYNDTSMQWETHDVWHNGSYWRCLRHQPVVEGGVSTYNEPSTANPRDWLKLLDSGRDGQSAPYYFEESYAWSSVSSGNTAPQDVQTWSSFVPSNNDPSKPYLWLRSRKMTYNAQTNSYTAGAYTYTRMTGENGTGIQIKGSIPSTAASPLDWLINNVTSPQTGDCYIYQADGHLWVWNGTQWQDVGQIKGSDGANAYIHVAWAHAIDQTLGYPTAGMGFTTSKGASDTYEWMGVCANDQENDPSDPSVYEWNEIKGERGYSAIRLDLDNENDTMLYKADLSNFVGNQPQTTWSLYMGSDDITGQVPTDSTSRRFTCSAGCTAEWTNIKSSDPTLCRRTIRVTSMTTDTATITMYITFGGTTYTTIMSLKRLVGLNKFELDVNPSSIAINVNDSALDSNKSCRAIVYRTDAQTGGRTKISSLVSPYRLYVNMIDSSGTETYSEVSSVEYGTNGYTWLANRSFSAYHIIFADGAVSSSDTSHIIDSETIPLVKCANGENGSDAVRVDLTNEMDSLMYKADGTTRIGNAVTTQVRLYDGYTDKTDKIGTNATLTVYERSNVSSSTLSGNTLTVSQITGDSAFVTLKLTYKQADYYVTFSIKRTVGQNKYELVCNPNSFNVNTSTSSSTSQSCTVQIYKVDSLSGDRSLCPSIPSGLYLYYAAGANTPQQLTGYSSGATFTAQNSNQFYRVLLLDVAYSASTYSSHIVDYETLPFITVSNGIDGRDGQDMRPNLLDGSNFVINVDSWEHNNSSVNSDGVYGQKSMYTTTTTAMKDFKQVVLNGSTISKIKPSTWYTLSFWVKGGKSSSSSTQTPLCGSYIYPNVVDTTVNAYLDGVAATPTTDGHMYVTLTSVWTKHTYTFKTKSSFDNDAKNVLFRTFEYTNSYVSCPKLEEGTTASEWCLSENDKKGADGEPAVMYQIVATPASVTLSQDETKSTKFSFSFYKREGNSTTRQSFSAYWAIFGVSGTSYERVAYSSSSTTSGSSTLSLSYSSAYTSYVIRIASSTISSSLSTFIVEQVIPIIRNGQKGSTGQIGRTPYFAGIWEDMYGETFDATDTSAPYFAVKQSGGTQYNMFLWVGANVQDYAINAANTPTSNDNWEIMVTDFKYLMSEAVFTQFAKLGAAVFNADWMYSEYGAGIQVLYNNTYSCTSSSARQIGNPNSGFSPSYNNIKVKKGETYTFYVTAYANAKGEGASASTHMRFTVYYYDTSLHQGRDNFSIVNSDTIPSPRRVYAKKFTAEYDGYASMFVEGVSGSSPYGYITRISATTSSGTYEDFTTSFYNTDNQYIVRSQDAQGGVTISGSYTSLSNCRLLSSQLGFYIVQGKKYKITVNGYTESTNYLNVALVKIVDNTKSNATNSYLSFTGTTRKNNVSYELTSNYTGYVYVGAWSSSSSYRGWIFQAYVTAVDPFIPQVAIDWYSGYAHFAGGNARFYPDGRLFLRSGYVSGFQRNVPTILDYTNVGEYVTSEHAWLKYSEDAWGMSAQYFGKIDSAPSSNHSVPTSIFDLRQMGNSIVFKASPTSSAIIHLPFITHVFGSTAKGFKFFYTNTSNDSDFNNSPYKNDLYRELMNARSYVGATIELYNVSGAEMFVVGVYNPYTDASGSSTSHAVPMSTDQECQDAVSKLHRLNSGTMVRLECKRLNVGNMFSNYNGGGVEIIYWEVQAGAAGIQADEFDIDFLNDM